MDHLSKVYGIGPVILSKLVHRLVALGYDRAKFKDNSYTKAETLRMLKTPVIYDTLPAAAKAYIKYKPQRAIPRKVMDKLNAELSSKVHGLKFVIAGSYRRGAPVSNDADIIIVKRNSTTSTIERFIRALIGSQIELLPPYAVGEDRISTMFRITVEKKQYVIKSDVFITNPDDYMFMLLYATGSGGFNIIMRAQAKRRGYLLNQKGLFRDGVKVPLNNEKAIFDEIGVKYRIPEERNISIYKKK